ncbi:phage Gp37/Gp68 family protein [Celeribacter sp.]|uniref:phage Gp37/Gp68 family protein n=1 Tax=Celeribacter sp. TaxID=1890673 RepID=UPI003A903F99
MADQTKIEWTDATWNVINGCTLVDDGCKNCYAATLAGTRLKNHPSREGLTKQNAAGGYQFNGQVRFIESELMKPMHWRKPRMVFVCAHGDLFHENVPDAWIDRVFAVMSLCPQHTFQILTKRPDRAREYFTFDDGFGRWGYIEGWAKHIANIPDGKTLAYYGGKNLPNVWLGTSVSDQASAETRIPDLLDTPAVVQFVSAEPLLGPVDIAPFLHGLDWVIVGGESGKNARPMHPDWARSMRDQCQAAGVPFFFKQWGEFADHTKLHAMCQGCSASSDLVINRNGHIIGGGAKGYGGFVDDDWQEVGGAWMCKTGKRAAGRLLDGREWSEMPRGDA